MSSQHNDASKTQSPQSYLYTGVVGNHLGSVAASVVSTLISYGRLSAREISHKLGLSPKQTRSALVSLLQLQCVQFWADSAAGASHTVYYLFHKRGVDLLLHGGDIIAHVKAEYGDEHAEVVQNVIENGSVAVRDFVGSFDAPETKAHKMDLLVALYREGWLCRLQPVDLHTPEDLWSSLYRDTLRQTPRLATTSEVKRVSEAKEKTRAKFTDVYAAGTAAADVFCVVDGIHQLRPHVTLAASLGRYERALRSRAFVLFSNLRMGLLTAQVYAACCRLAERQSPPLYHRLLDISGLVVDPEDELMYLRSVENALVDNKSTVFTVRDVAKALAANIDLRYSVLTQNFVKPGKRAASSPLDHPSKKIKLEDGSESIGVSAEVEGSDLAELVEPNMDPNELLSASELRLEAVVSEHMRLLALNSTPFLLETGPGSYTIPFLQVARQVKQFHYEALIKATLGANALRVLRCIKHMRLVDEKAISNAVLLKDKAVKNEVYKLVTNNVVEIQEVPRSADRAALKTFYLFRHRETPCYEFVARSLMFAMGDVLRNIERFKADHRILLDKCEREDVKGHEDELLLESELKTLRELQVREVKNVARFNRIKWLQFIFGTL